MKLLVVDDDAAVLDVLLVILEDAGFHVMPAASGEEAVTKVSAFSPDALVTDLDLGAGMNGLQLAAEVRLRWPNLPIVYISGRQWLMQGYALDDHEVFVPKPFHQRDLISGVYAVSAKAALLPV